MQSPLRFSIIVPIYKTERYICECVDSILAQSYPHFEAILVDDGSPDACPDICDGYAQKDGRIRVIHKQNGGLVSARKAGAEAASGDYVVNLDSDDYIDRDFLLNIANDIECSHADVICFGLDLFGGSSKAQMRYLYPVGVYDLTDTGAREQILKKAVYDASRGMNYGCFLYSICSKAIKRSIYKDLQERVENNITTGEDLVFTLSLFDAIQSVYISEHHGYRYRVNDSSMTHTYKAGDLKNAFRVVSLVLEHAKNDPILEHQAYAYALIRVWEIVSGYAVRARSYRELKRFIISEMSPDQQKLLSRARMQGRGKREKAIIFLTKRRIWRALYLIVRHRRSTKERTEQ